jgi:hypothetical protein
MQSNGVTWIHASGPYFSTAEFTLEPEDGSPQSADIWVGVIFSMLLNSYHLDTSNPFIFAYISLSPVPFL